MALTTEQIDAEAFARWGDMKGGPLALCRGFARAIDAEARRDALEESARDGDPRAATRTAVVLAAAAIGEQMP